MQTLCGKSPLASSFFSQSLAEEEEEEETSSNNGGCKQCFPNNVASTGEEEKPRFAK